MTESQHKALKKLVNKLETKVNTESEKSSVNTQVSTDQTLVKTNPDIMFNTKSEEPSVKTNDQSVKKDTQLPQTSDNKVEAAILTGLGTVVSILGLAGIKRKKN